jgi:hypothetical protein
VRGDFKNAFATLHKQAAQTPLVFGAIHTEAQVGGSGDHWSINKR